jgi:Ca2+-binding RTX toxin-like protein
MLRARSASRRLACAIEFAVAEVLEPRRLFAAIESGVLVARGTANGDAISLRRSGGDDVIVTTNGANQTFDMDDFTGVRLEGLGGNDTFNMIDALTSPLVRNTTVLGGAGDDTLDYSARTNSLTFRLYEEASAQIPIPFLTIDSSGGQSDKAGSDVERFVGGSGDDNFFINDSGDIGGETPLPDLTLEGRGGNDTFHNPTNLNVTSLGGAGDDFFEIDESSTFFAFGEDGADTFYLDNEAAVEPFSGGPGVDTIDVGTYHRSGVLDMRLYPDVENAVGVGSSGAVNSVIGYGLANHISGEADGENALTLSGGGGNDTLVGGREDDSLTGDEGDDSIIGNDGNDTLDGGNGTDFGDGGPGTNTLISIENGPGSTDPTSPSIAITGGVLVARGTDAADTISIRRTGTDNVIVTVNALSSEFDMDDFPGGVRLEGLGGNDTFNLIDPLATPVLRHTTVLGGAGDDSVSYATRTAQLAFSVRPAVSFMNSGDEQDTLDHVETIIGGSGNDFFFYGEGQAIPQQEEDDSFTFRLEGRGGDDRFVSQWTTTENLKGVTLFGGDGNDFFEQNDLGGRVFAEGGNDTINIRSREANYANFLDGGSGTDLVIGAGGNRSLLDLREYPNIENADLGSFAGVVIGTDAANTIDGSDADAVTINGLGGNDTLIGGSQADSLDGGAGNDLLVGNDGNDTLDGAGGTDFADGDGGSNSHISIEQFAGSTPLIAIVGNVLRAYGTGSGETITIERVLSDDVIVRVGSISRQLDIDDFQFVHLLGLGGNDTITVLDPVSAGAITRIVTLDGGGGNDALTGNSGIDILRGGSGADTLVGLGGDDTLEGSFGNDRLFGGTGMDSLDGDDGDDFIDASDSAGGDTVAGGAGNDTADVDPGDDVSSVETLS